VDSVSFLGAFLAGLLSFLSPCVLPLIPAYLSFLTGLTVTELSQATGGSAAAAETSVAPSRLDIVIPSLLFVLGFSIVFVGLGATASVLGRFLLDYRAVIEKVAGLVVIAFGILMLGIVKVPWLYGEARMEMGKSKTFGRGAAVVMGMAFAAGWTPCVGPILGTILALAGSTGDAVRGAALLLAYSAGLGLPFVLVALLFGRVSPLLSWLNRHALVISRVAGVLLILVGVLIFTGRLGVLAGWLTSVLPTIKV
jgi:cytochrome c-type biogenesis protein